MAGSEKKLKFTYNAPVTITFAILALIALILGKFTGGKSTELLFSVYRSPISVFSVLRLFLHVLGHSSIAHYTGNMMLFILLGPMIEEKYGSLNFLEMIAIVAAVSGIINIIFFPGTALLGASGVVFMMMILVSASDLREGEIPITMILVMVLYLGNEVINMIFQKDNISQLTHIIGGIMGALFGYLYNVKQIHKKK